MVTVNHTHTAELAALFLVLAEGFGTTQSGNSTWLCQLKAKDDHLQLQRLTERSDSPKNSPSRRKKPSVQSSHHDPSQWNAAERHLSFNENDAGCIACFAARLWTQRTPIDHIDLQIECSRSHSPIDLTIRIDHDWTTNPAIRHPGS